MVASRKSQHVAPERNTDRAPTHTSAEDDTHSTVGSAQLKLRHAKVRELGIAWFPLSMLVVVHASALAAMVLFPRPSWRVLATALGMYAFTGLGITAGYHRMWSHRCYDGSLFWRVLWAVGGGCALQGSIKWWSRLHRLHHRFPDEDCDPYGPQRGFWYSHCVWIFRPRHIPQLKLIDVSDLDRDPVVHWQHRLYPFLALPIAYGLPLLFARENVLETLLWAGAMTRVLVWHTTWCVNSLAHWLGSNNYSDDQTAKDHVFTAIMTLGEGYHDFHHSFPNDWRNGIRWYHYDPTKWIIAAASAFGAAFNLRQTPESMIQKARYLMDEKEMERRRSSIPWPADPASLPTMTMSQYAKAAKKGDTRLIALDGFVLDVTSFLPSHPGGSKILRAYAGRDPDAIANAFHAHHKHTSAALHLSQMMRVAKLVCDEDSHAGAGATATAQQ